MVAYLFELLFMQLLKTQLEQLLVRVLLWDPQYHENVVILDVPNYVVFHQPDQAVDLQKLCYFKILTYLWPLHFNLFPEHHQ